jgi:hypothetical protein
MGKLYLALATIFILLVGWSHAEVPTQQDDRRYLRIARGRQTDSNDTRRFRSTLEFHLTALLDEDG